MRKTIHATFTFKEVLAALTTLHHVDEKDVGAFAGRIRHFQRLGISTDSPGKGKNIKYDFDSVLILAFCLQLAEIGMPPEIITLIVIVWGKDIVDAALELNEGDSDWEGSERTNHAVFWFSPRLLARPPTLEKFKHAIKERSGIELASDVTFELSAANLRVKVAALCILITDISALRVLVECALNLKP